MENIIQCDDTFLPHNISMNDYHYLGFRFLYLYISHILILLSQTDYLSKNNYSRALSSNKKDNQILSYTLPPVLLYVLPLYFKEMKDGL